MSKDIRLMAEDERDLAKALWKEAFDDSDAFINWYFDNKILPGQSLCMFDADKLISIVHMIPYTIRVQDRALESAFIAGVATSKDRRGEGLMRTMLFESLSLLKSRGIVLTHLYPFSHAFYEAFGWTAYTYMNKLEISAMPCGSQAEIVETTDFELIKPVYERMMSDYDGYVMRGPREWRWRLGEIGPDGGKCAVLMRDGSAQAYVIYYGGKEKAEVVETAYIEEADIAPLLSYVLSQGSGSAEYYLPALPGEPARKHGMARVVDAHALLETFGALELLDTYRITDSFAPWNNIGNPNGKPIDIGRLAWLVHNGTDECEELKVRSFAPRRTCIFEAY